MAMMEHMYMMIVCFFSVIRHPLMTAVMGVLFDKGSDCVPLDDDRNGLLLDGGGNGVHIDILVTRITVLP